MGKLTINIYKWWFSIVMLVYQRVERFWTDSHCTARSAGSGTSVLPRDVWPEWTAERPFRCTFRTFRQGQETGCDHCSMVLSDILHPSNMRSCPSSKLDEHSKSHPLTCALPKTIIGDSLLCTIVRRHFFSTCFIDLYRFIKWCKALCAQKDTLGPDPDSFWSSAKKLIQAGFASWSCINHHFLWLLGLTNAVVPSSLLGPLGTWNRSTTFQN